MAILSTADRLAARWDFVALVMAEAEAIGLTKPELQAAVDAADDWCQANAASFNAALPLPARNELTAKQKARLLMAVVRKRYEVA